MVKDDGAPTNIWQYSLWYKNKKMTEDMIHEIFDNKVYAFTTKNKMPYIIDAGSNIGLSTVFFKSQYPNAKILCFEPDPNSFELLKKNITFNCLMDVKLVNAALANKTGKIDFYGEINSDNPYSCGNSIIKQWGEQRLINNKDYLLKNKIKVQAVKLSDYIDQEVDFLKLDVEGAEKIILEDLDNKVELIKEIAMEVHCTKHAIFKNHVNFIISFLKKHHFLLEITQVNVEYIFPPDTQSWVTKANPKLFEIRAKKKIAKTRKVIIKHKAVFADAVV